MWNYGVLVSCWINLFLLNFLTLEMNRKDKGPLLLLFCLDQVTVKKFNIQGLILTKLPVFKDSSCFKKAIFRICWTRLTVVLLWSILKNGVTYNMQATPNIKQIWLLLLSMWKLNLAIKRCLETISYLTADSRFLKWNCIVLQNFQYKIMQFNPQENIKAKSSIIKDAHVMCYPCNSIDHDKAFPLRNLRHY